MTALGNEVYAWRKRANLTQEELGKRCYLHTNQIGRLEKGQSNADLKTLVKLSFVVPVFLLSGLQLPQEPLPADKAAAKEAIERRLQLVQKKIGQCILQILRRQKKDQSELALALRMEDSEISKYINGHINLQYLSLVKIAGKLQVAAIRLLQADIS